MGKKRKKETWKLARRPKKRWAKKRMREEEIEENETGSAKRRCVGSFSVEAIDIFSQEGDLESCGGLSWEDLLEKHEDLSNCEPDTRAHVPVVPDVTDVLVSPSSVVTEFCGGVSCCSDCEFVEAQSFSFSTKRAHSWTVTQEEMRFEGSQVKALPLSRRRMMPPTPLQNSYSSFEEEQEHFEVEDQIWCARDRTVIARTKQYLEESESLKVEVEELESLQGPDDSDVDFRRILDEARDRRGCAIFETFS